MALAHLPGRQVGGWWLGAGIAPGKKVMMAIHVDEETLWLASSGSHGHQESAFRSAPGVWHLP